jgi:hypothetical protein
MIDIPKIEFSVSLRTLPQVLNGHGEQRGDGGRE